MERTAHKSPPLYARSGYNNMRFNPNGVPPIPAPKPPYLSAPSASSASSASSVASSSGAGPVAAAPINTDLEKELTCSICTSIYLHPVTLLDCLHSYCGSCAKEWFSSSSSTPSSAYPVSKGCPTCRQSVRAIKPSPHLASITETFLKHNPEHARDPEETARLAKVYSPGDRIISDRSPGDSRNRSLSSLSNRRAGEGWWDAWVDDAEENEEQFYAAISASLRDLIPRATTASLASVNLPSNSSPSSTTSQAGSSSGSNTDTGRQPRLLTLMARNQPTILTTQPQVECDRCGQQDIQSSVHFHCNICRGSDYDICNRCFMGDGARCPGGHEMISRKYNAENGMMEKGIFCDTPACRKVCNDIFWSCSACSTPAGTYKYCPDCVNNATSCAHDLVAFSASVEILRRCGLGPNGARQQRFPAQDLVQPEPVSVTTRCDLCSQQIAPSTTYFHCRACHGADWDCHTACLAHYVPSSYAPGRNGDGVAKCLLQHPLQALIQVQMPDARNTTHYVRRALPSTVPFGR